jgi:hypothetical protein
VRAVFSKRFSREVRVTDHAAERMIERSIDEARLLDLIETGETKYKDEARLWIFKSYADRNDNLICAAAVVETELVVKTIMHHFEIT